MDFELDPAQRDLQQRARSFIKTVVLPHYREWPVANCDYSPELNAHLKGKLAEYGLAKLIVPKEFGGQGLGPMEDVIVLAEFSKSPRRMPGGCLLYTSPSPRDLSTSRMPSSA